MNTELFIARRIIVDSENKKKISKPIISIAIFGIALGLAVMILAVSIVTGFKKEIRNKVVGFSSHIQIINYDSNSSYETKPIDKRPDLLPSILAVKGVVHVQAYGIKAGIIKTDTDIQGVVLKGIGSDFDWSFFRNFLVQGKEFSVCDTSKTDKVIISQNLASLLKLKVGNNLLMYFIEEPPRMRKFVIEGIYKTSLEEFDKLYVLADLGHIQKLNNWTENQITGYEIMSNDFDNIEVIAQNITNIAGAKFNSDGSMLRVSTIKERNPQIFDWLELQNINVWVILILMTVVAGFNMVSGLLIIILERTNMIGVLKALGSQNWSIRRIFLYKAAYLIGKGLLWGNLIGIVLCALQYYFKIVKLDPSSYYVDTVPINFNWIYLLLLNIGTLAVTVIMMILPSYIISRISPVKAIQFN